MVSTCGSNSGSGSGSGEGSSFPPLPTSPPTKSSSGSLKRPSSPPLPTSPPSSSTLRDPLVEDTPCESPSSLPLAHCFEERSKKRRCIELTQDQSLIHGFELQQHAIKILNSNDLSVLQDAINDCIKGKNALSKTILDSFVVHYPNAFSLKLAKLLQSQPPIPIRTEIVNFLHDVFTGNGQVSPSVLIDIRNPLLDSVKAESEETLLPQLCQTVCLVATRLYNYPLDGWIEYIQYICTSITGIDKESELLKGLMLLAEMPVGAHKSTEFWLEQDNYEKLFEQIINLNLFDSQDEKLRSMVCDGATSLLEMSTHLGRTDVCEHLLPIPLRFIDRQGEEEVQRNKDDVFGKVNRLAELISVDPGEIFDGKEGDVFWCMIRLAEVKGVCDDLKIAAIILLNKLDEVRMEQLEIVMQNFSADEVKRVFVVAIDMMASVVDDPIWYDVDNPKCKDAGFTVAYNRGLFLLSWLSFEGNPSVVVPTVIDLITTNYAYHGDWRVRQAAMMALGSFAQGHFEGDMDHYLDTVAIMVLMLLNDENPRVTWATMHAIKCLSPYKELITAQQYHMTFLNAILPIVNYSFCDRVQSYAIIAVRSLILKCGLEDQKSPFLEEIVALLIVFLKHEKRKLQEEAVETLKVIAISIRNTFRQLYYNTTMTALKDILFAEYNPTSPSFLVRAKCLECMATLVRKVESDKFGDEEVSQVMESMVSLQEKLSVTDILAKVTTLKALDLFCQCPKVDNDIFIHKVIRVLLRFAQVGVDLNTDHIPLHKSLDEAKNLVQSVRIRACNILSYCAVRSCRKFSPYIGKVARIFAMWIGCSSAETRKACISGVPNLLQSIKVCVQNVKTRESLTNIIVKALVEQLSKEVDGDLSTKMLKILPRCIQTSGSFFSSQLIETIAEEINRIIGKVVGIEIERVKEEESSEVGSECLPNEEIFQDANNLIETTVETFSAKFLPYVDALLSNVATFWVHDIPDRVTAYIISIFNIIVRQFPEKLTKYHNKYVATACDALREDRSYCQLDAARAIGIGAELGGLRFKSSVAAIDRLCDLTKKRLSFRGQSGTSLYDIAVAALGKILEFQWDNIDNRKEVVQNWLNCLPLRDDYNEAKYAHGLLSKMIRRSDKYLFGHNNENLPKITSTVKVILSPPDRLATEEVLNEMVGFLNQEVPFSEVESSSNQVNNQNDDPLLLDLRFDLSNARGRRKRRMILNRTKTTLASRSG